MKKLFILILFVVSCCVSCSSNEITKPDETKTYEILFYDGQKMISKINVTNYNEVTFPKMQDKVINGDTFKFIGWDMNSDNKVDIISSIERNLAFHAVYEKVEPIIENRDYYITYHLSDNNEIKILFKEGLKLEVPEVLETERFFYYEDKQGNVYTDKEGNVLSYIKCNQDIELFPKIIHSGDDLQSLCLFSYPKSVVAGDEPLNFRML